MSAKNGWLWTVGISSALGPQALMGSAPAASKAAAKAPEPAAKPAKSEAAPAAGGEFRGNVKSKAFHAPGCRYYEGADCSASFASRDQAVEAGYKPCKTCKP